MKTKIATTIALLLLLPLAGAQTGGGGVNNVVPSIETGVTGDKGSQNNLNPVTETFTFTLRDNNGVADLQGVKITSNDATFGERECLDVTVGSSCSGWTFTDPVGNDGLISGTFTYNWPDEQTAGTYTQVICVKDETAYVCDGSDDQTIFTNAGSTTISGTTYFGDGTTDGSNWGNWAAIPGATDVSCTNYLKADNVGTASDVVTISFTPTMFSGGGATIDIDNNIKFGQFNGATANAATPSWGATDTDGAATFTVPAKTVSWFCYEIEAIPNPAPDATYTASYNFT